MGFEGPLHGCEKVWPAARLPLSQALYSPRLTDQAAEFLHIDNAARRRFPQTLGKIKLPRVAYPDNNRALSRRQHRIEKDHPGWLDAITHNIAAAIIAAIPCATM